MRLYCTCSDCRIRIQWGYVGLSLLCEYGMTTEGLFCLSGVLSPVWLVLFVSIRDAVEFRG